MIQLLIPMSGQGTRYQKAGYKDPKPLIPVNGRSMIERVLENFPSEWPSFFVMAENHKQTALPQELGRLRPKGQIAYVPVHSEGPLKAIEKGIELLDENLPVLVNYCDYGMVWDATQFERFVRHSGCDACVISYRGFHAHYLSPVKYAYSRLEGERIVEMREKGSFTPDREAEFASSGGYYFRSAKILKEAIAHQRKIELRVNGEFYTSLTVESLLRLNPQAHVRVFEIPGFFQWGTPEDLARFEYWESTYSAYNRTAGTSPGTVDQILMPMAGLGSRFKELTEYPKPFIPVDGLPMFRRALNSLPKAQSKTQIVGLESMKPLFAKVASQDLSIKFLQQTPEGQALSTLEGATLLDMKKDVLVSSCDHGIVQSNRTWEKFRSQPDCDAAIFTVRNFPGAAARPEAFAYVVPESPHDPFPIVKSVSVKKPVSSQPSKDHLLVGTFWFRNAEILNLGIQKLKEKNVRVNNELYLDSVFEILMQMGKKVRMIPLEGYINWGDPDSLAEALYWYEVFTGQRLSPRTRYPGINQKW